MTLQRILIACLCILPAFVGGCQSDCTACDNTGTDGGAVADSSQPAKSLIGAELSQWKSINFGGEGDVYYKDGALNLDVGLLTGVQYQGDLTELFGEDLENYEITLDAMRVEGIDIFLGLTFPVGKEGHVSYVLGGWAGVVNGISNLDGLNASENATTTYKEGGYKDGQWYRARVRVTAEKIECWVDDKQIVDVKRADYKEYDTHGMVLDSKPFGIFTYQTWGAYRNLTVRKLY